MKKLSTELLEKEKALQESQIIEQVNEVYTTLTNVHVKDIIKEEDTDTVSVQLEALNSNGESAVKFLLKFNDGEVEYSPLELSVPHEDFFSDPEGIAFSALGCPLFFKKLLEVVHGPDEEESE